MAGFVEYLPFSNSGGGGDSSSVTSRVVNSDYSVLPNDYLIISSGGNTGTFPTFSGFSGVFVIKNEGTESDTLNGNGAAIENGNTLSPSQSRAFSAGQSNWVEVT